MNFLLVNDDGIENPNILITERVLKEFGKVFVSAPLQERSGYSMGITIHHGTQVKRLDETHVACEGTPADCVYVGMNTYGEENIDIVVSGVNVGYNEGYDSLFSGTVGAGLMGSLFGKKVLILSADYSDRDQVEIKTRECLKYVFDHQLLETAPVLSINYPNKKFAFGKGFKLAHIFNFPLIEKVVEKDDLVKTERDWNAIPLPDSDRQATKEGYYSITPLKAVYEDEAMYKILKKSMNK